jgi:predicted transcriptional regulator
MMELPTPDSIKKKRVKLGLTQSELAERAGVSQPLIARIESGDVDPRLSTIRNIIAALDDMEKSRITAKDLMTAHVVSLSPDVSWRTASPSAAFRRARWSRPWETGTSAASVTPACAN